MEKLWDRPVELGTQLEVLGTKRRGKVRDIYDLGDKLLLVATDRISAFDVILQDGIPGKGYVLTQMSRFWFEWLWQMEDIVPHHLVSTKVEKFPSECHSYRQILEGRTMLVQKATPLPVECIVRGYLSGSALKEYRQSGRVCDQPLPGGLRESGRLPEPIFTPSTKAVEGHDQNISFEEMKTMIGEALAEEIRAVSLRIYQRASAYGETKGIIIADTKLEFGLDPRAQQLMLIDEILTPDSSRFWPKDTYAPGGPQPSFDKQYVRDYLDSIGWNHKPPTPNLPEEVIRQTSLRYQEALE
ncbi:MAG: phosphoribosylaminoimidazolesuccinocarboxamide synthase, partial [Nitrospiria bacterium]